MKIKSNTIVITGGTSGIGLEMANKFISLGNTVIVTGRDLKKINDIKKLYPKLNAFQCDISKSEEVDNFYKEITSKFPEINILINNAGVAKELDFKNSKINFEEINQEISTNLTGLIYMSSLFSKHLQKKEEAAIMNISSALAFVPATILPVYSATKAGVHSFSQSLRRQLTNTNVKVFEVAPSMIKTPMMYKFNKNLKNATSIGTTELIEIIIENFIKDNFEILPGQSKFLKIASRIFPTFIAKLINP